MGRTLSISKKIKKKRTKKRTNTIIFLFCMLFLPVLNWLIFWLYVNISSITLAFRDARTNSFTFQNFVIFWESLTSPTGDIGVSLINTFKYFGTSLVIIMPVALFISYFLYKKVRGHRIFRVIFYLPAIISGVAMVAVYKNFINPNGPLDLFLRLFGKSVPPEGFLAKESTATLTIIIYCIWTGFSGNVLIYCGAMARVPIECLESATLDGCGPVRELFQIILPLIWPTISTQIVLLFTGIFGVSGPILLFTYGEYGTSTLAFWIWKSIYTGSEAAYNIISATGLVLTAIGVPLILLVRLFMEKVVPPVEY